MKSDLHDLAALEDALGHRFRRRALLEQALTHASHAREMDSKGVAAGKAVPAPDNEQMEFLGDTVLSFVVSQELFRRFPEYQEGELSKLRAHIVSARHLLRPARALKIGDFLRLGKGEERSGGRGKSALLTDALEAIIAALYLDGGLDSAHRFILEAILEPELAEVHKLGDTTLPVMDYKSALQEAAHAGGRPQPRYVLVKEEGPDHRKLFTMEAHVAASAEGDKGFVRRSEGSTKKLAEQGAARKAWEYLQSLKAGSVDRAPASASESKQS
jgi:ribonuclease III